MRQFSEPALQNASTGLIKGGLPRADLATSTLQTQIYKSRWHFPRRLFRWVIEFFSAITFSGGPRFAAQIQCTAEQESFMTSDITVILEKIR